MKSGTPKPVGAPPAVLALHKDQTLDANECAHAMKENAERLLEELDDFMDDGVFTRAEYRHVRGHIALGHRLAEEQCSILKWSWKSLMAIEKLIDAYRLRIQEMKKAAGGCGLLRGNTAPR
ncbi:MAG: hypothetical protein JW820_18645 [Spirochaetales bacterium]|nr:hypothetical protein [Spirochaetales bacterium]